MTSDLHTTTENAELARRLIDSINERDIDAAAALLDPGYRAEWPDGELDFTAALEREIVMMTGLPDTHFAIDAITGVADGRVLVETTVTGTHSGPLHLPHGVVLEPTGRSLSLPFLLIMQFLGGRLVRERLFFDHHELIHQLTAAG